ncbi:outer membrane beta-barrel family protein [Pontibacter vulgaris]|uniref:outer membrane beta-barrel family protein n=1 Tax=Pontibacter vulgaris TaxID=2905679 RepID=UPI001FA77C46|nr:outer membrane beta-barrel family protein [Pontibacter vulgaris]
MRKLFLPILLLVFTNLSAQQASIKGSVIDGNNKAVAYANVLLLKSADSSLVKGMLSEESGAYFFEGLTAGKYKVVATMVGYTKARSSEVILQAGTESINLAPLRLSQSSTNLKEVVIEGQKPLIEQQLDKTVMNVGNSLVAAGNTALEVLEKAPGVIVDQNDNISMRGRAGVIVMIDGKQVPMTGAELANVLRGMSANSVDKIELITNPSSKYDAAGNAGIIDIKLKRDKSLGTNGTLTSSFGHGRYAKSNQSIQLNHRAKKLNVFGNYNYVYRHEYTKLDIYRKFIEGNSITGIYDQKNRFDFRINTHSARLGADYYLSPKTVIGVVTNGFISDFNRTNSNRSDGLNNQGQIDSTFITDAIAGHNRGNQAINFNFKHTIDSTGREITADLDYIAYQNADKQDFTTNFYTPGGELMRTPYLLYGTLDGNLSIKSAKADYTQPWKAINGKLEAGLKSSLVSADNDLQFYDRSNGGNVFDTGKSNHFLYDENINAAYLNASKKWEKASLQLGLRLENTRAKGEQLASLVDEEERKFDRNYTQLFPSAFMGYTLSKMHDLGLSLSRRINRPSYNQLNPFKNFLDPSTYSAGNPFLKPELSYAFEFTHTYNQRFVTKFSYSHTTDVMVQVLSPDVTQDKLVAQTFQNLAKYDYYGMSLSVPFSVGNWFNSINNGTLYYGLYRGNLANTNLRNGMPTFNINTNNTFTLTNGWSAELNGVYRHRDVYAFMNINPLWFASVGVQKQFWDKKGSLKLNLTDAFYTNKTRATTAVNSYTENFYQRRDSQVATLTFNYRFGQSQVAPSRRRNSGAEEEKSRAGGAN